MRAEEEARNGLGSTINLTDDEADVYWTRYYETYGFKNGQNKLDHLLCKDREDKWDQSLLWSEKEWQEQGIVYLDQEHYDHYITSVNGNVEQPWFIAFIKSQFGQQGLMQTASLFLAKFKCLQEAYPHMRFGFVDTYKDEMIKASFDFKGQKRGEQVPVAVVIYKGQVYYTTQNTLGLSTFNSFANLTRYSEEYVGDKKQWVQILPWKAPHNKVSLAYEYIKKEAAISKESKEVFKTLKKSFLGETWYWKTYVEPATTGKSSTEKGEAIIFYVYLPIVLSAVLLLFVLVKLVCWCCCRKKKTDTQGTQHEKRD